MTELPWNERVPMPSIHPDAASRNDVTRLAAELMEAKTRIRELEGIVKADDERLQVAGERVGLYLGCDTADAMADKIQAAEVRERNTQRTLERSHNLAVKLSPALDDAIAELKSMRGERDTAQAYTARLAEAVVAAVVAELELRNHTHVWAGNDPFTGEQVVGLLKENESLRARDRESEAMLIHYQQRLQAAQAYTARLAEALQPFALLSDEVPLGRVNVPCDIFVADLRRARTALSTPDAQALKGETK